ncbi:MAG: peptidyl-prolyl cis-trans isomerase [Lactobacillales bacterium]|jgi:foldase protein PrsA|nr:peptidyl-prolyl cis-trans isomerase [Lactobacillales bacterium]
MKLTKKLSLLAVAGITTVTLAGCGSQTIATFKGGSVTVQDFYDQEKRSQTAQTAVQQLLLTRVFEKQYGNLVTAKEVDSMYKSQQEGQYGNDTKAFEEALTTAGYTPATFKAYLKGNLSIQKGIESKITKTDLETAIKDAWVSFHPEVTAQIITATTQEEADSLHAAATADGADFATVAKDDSAATAQGQEVKFSSTTSESEIPTAVKEAAWKLKNGEISAVIKASSTDPQTYQTVDQFFIIKMVKQQAKGTDITKYKKELTEIAKTAKTQDAEFVKGVIADTLKKANVKITDKTFSDVLAQFAISSETSSAAK